MQYIVIQCIIYGHYIFFDTLNYCLAGIALLFRNDFISSVTLYAGRLRGCTSVTRIPAATRGGNAARGSNRAQADCSALLAAIFAEVFRVIFLIILFVNFVSPCLATDNIEPFPAVMQGTFAQGIKSQAVPIPVDTAGSSISICVF